MKRDQRVYHKTPECGRLYRTELVPLTEKLHRKKRDLAENAKKGLPWQPSGYDFLSSHAGGLGLIAG